MVSALMNLFAALFVVSTLAVHASTHVSTPTQQTADHRTIALGVGQTTTISIDGVRNFSIAPGDVANMRVQANGKFADLTGLRAGTATLTFVRTDGSMFVYDITVT